MRVSVLVACLVLVIGAVPGAAAASAGMHAATGPAPGGAAAPLDGAAVAGEAGETGATGAAQADCSYPVSATDATGAEVTVEAEPERVVVLAPSTAQIAWEVGAARKVVGLPVGPYTSYLEGADNRTNVWNTDGTINQEAVVALEPDLVLTASITPNSTVSDLRSAGLTVYKTPLDRSLDSITGKVATFGRMLGACEGARETNAAFNESLAEIRETAPDRSPRVLYYFFNFTTGSNTFIHEAIETAGGDNVAANAGIEGFKPLNDEVVASRDPQWIVVPSSASIPDREPFASTSAVRANRTLTVDANYISQPGPRVVIPMRAMAEAFAETGTPTPTASPTPTPTDSPTPSATPTESPTPTPSPTPGDATDQGAGATETTTGQPGFGVTAALVALLALAALAGRRS